MNHKHDNGEIYNSLPSYSLVIIIHGLCPSLVFQHQNHTDNGFINGLIIGDIGLTVLYIDVFGHWSKPDFISK